MPASFNHARSFLALVLGFAVAGCSALPFMDDEEDIALSEVPAAVREAALAAVPGLQIEEAERERDNGSVEYELEGTVDGREVEIALSETGKVLEIEYQDEQEDNDWF